MGISTAHFNKPSILTPGTRSSGIGKEPLESWKDIQYLSDSNSDGSPASRSVDHRDSNQLTDPPPSFASDYIQPSVGEERSVTEALKSLVRLPGSINEVRNLDYESINVNHVVFLPQQYDGNVVFEFPPAISVLGDVASQMEEMERKHNGHPWCKIFTTNIKNDVDLIFRKSLCASKFECQENECSYFVGARKRNQIDWSGTSTIVCKVGKQVPVVDNIVCMHCKVLPKCLATCSARMYYILPRKGSMTRACLHFGFHNHPISKGYDRRANAETRLSIAKEVKRSPQSNPSSIILKSAKSLVQTLVLNTDGSTPTKFDDDSLRDVMVKLAPLSSPNIRNHIASMRSAHGSTSVESNILELKRLSRYSYIHGSLFPGQDRTKSWLFKMSTTGRGVAWIS